MRKSKRQSESDVNFVNFKHFKHFKNTQSSELSAFSAHSKPDNVDCVDSSQSTYLPEDFPTAQQLETAIEQLRYKRDFRKILRNTVSSLIVVAAIAVLISMLFLPVLRVTGSSMTPTMQNDELIICAKRSNFKSGDIVAFYYNNKILLKRVIGTAGDVIDISEDGTVYVNGNALDEPYVSELAFGECDIELPYQVPDNRIFVMGDHRSVSVDSRSSTVGCIADEFVIGKVIFRIWPWETVGKI